MSDHEHANRPMDETGLTDAEVDRALATSLARGEHLVRRRHQRRAALSGLAAVALFAGGFGILSSLSDDGGVVRVTPAVEGTSVERSTSVASTTEPDRGPTSTELDPVVPSIETTIAPGAGQPGDQVSAPAASATTASPVPTSAPRIPDDPRGYERVDRPGGVTELINRNPIPAQPPTTTDPGVDLGGGAASESRSEAVRSARFVSPYVLRVELECDPGTEISSIRYRRSGSEVTVQASSRGIYPGGSCTTGVRPPIDLVFRAGDLPRNVRAMAGLLDE